MAAGKGGITGVVLAKNRFKLSASASAKKCTKAWHKMTRLFELTHRFFF
jgi:hypothetical protein